MKQIKIEFEIPEWAKGTHIYIFAGRELLGFQEVRIEHKNSEFGMIGHHIIYKPLRIKQEDGRCTGCGECCKGCPFLMPNGCSLGRAIPLSCVKSICTDNYENCTEKLEVVE